MSPVRTATRSRRSKLSRVHSSRRVFPDPGELIKFRHRILSTAKRALKPAAMRSFSLKTLRSSSTRSIFDLQIGELQFVASQELRIPHAAVRTCRISLRCSIGAPTGSTLITARAVFNFECQRLKFRPTHQSFKTKAHGVRIHSREFADPDAHLIDVAGRKAPSFRANRIQHRIGNTYLVHHPALNRFLAIDRRRADRRSAMYPAACAA